MSVYSSTNQRERTRTLSTDPDDRKGDECDTVASSLTISTAKRFVTYSYYDWFGVVPASVFFSAFSSTNFNSCSNSFKDVLKFRTAYAYRIDLCSFSASDSACFDKSFSAIINRSYCARTYLCDVEDIHKSKSFFVCFRFHEGRQVEIFVKIFSPFQRPKIPLGESGALCARVRARGESVKLRWSVRLFCSDYIF